MKNLPLIQKLKAVSDSVAKTLGKRVAFTFVDEASAKLKTESEKNYVETVLGQVFESLMHLVRNAVDHGIESRGHVTVRVGVENDGNAFFEVSDDGKGIDSKAIRARALEVDLADPKSNSSEIENLSYIFHPGFSTKNEITEISGRGVGLAVVKNQIAKWHGDVSVTSRLGQGTTFKMSFPIQTRAKQKRAA